MKHTEMLQNFGSDIFFLRSFGNIDRMQESPLRTGEMLYDESI